MSHPGKEIHFRTIDFSGAVSVSFREGSAGVLEFFHQQFNSHLDLTGGANTMDWEVETVAPWTEIQRCQDGVYENIQTLY